MKTIVYEMNEVPKKVFDFYANAFPISAFSKLRKNSKLYLTHTADVGHLSPWVTWPTMHRGVSNIDHTISDLGQDLTYVNKDFPSVWEMLAQSGRKVGVFGSLQSYPLPKTLDNYEFYLPDTFAAGNECYPSEINAFQAFNLSMVRINGRNVSKGLVVKDAARFLIRAKKLGLSFKTFKKIGFQVAQEQLNADRVVRRRTSQAEIAFDLYFEQLKKNLPDISFFFTNHVASSLHRYWPTVFPKDYEEGKFELDWCQRWSREIPHSINVANFQLNKLIDFCDQNNHRLIVASSMGQGAVEEVEPTYKQVLITDIKKLLNFLNISDTDWEPRMSMSPQVVIKPKIKSFMPKLARLNDIYINEKKIDLFETSTGDIRFDLNLTNVKELNIFEFSNKIDPTDLGLSNINLQDASNSYAYHIPQGILMNYEPYVKRKNNLSEEWTDVSVLDFAPSILRSLGVNKASYMHGLDNLFI